MIYIDTRAAREGLRLLAAGIVNAAAQAMRVAVAAAEKSAKSTTLWNDQSGETRGSIKGEVESYSRGFVSAGGASVFLENGTKAASVARTVPMRINGALIFRHFKHPGIKARPFMAEARVVGEATLEAALTQFINAAIARV